MPRKSMSTRLAATTALLLAAGALSVPAAASAKPADAPPVRDYKLTVTTNPTSTHYYSRRVNVTGTLTKADGTPAPNVAVAVKEIVRFHSWNPWGDPIDPTEYEPRDLGKPVTDANGKFTIRNVTIDHVSGSSLLNVQPQVDISASYDVDGNPNTPQDGYYASAKVAIKSKVSALSYTVNKKKVKKGTILTVQGKVILPRGVEREGTEVFLQTYWENEYRVKTTAEEDGFFVMSVRVRGYDNRFVLRTAPRDLYVGGVTKRLPIINTSLPRR